MATGHPMGVARTAGKTELDWLKLQPSYSCLALEEQSKDRLMSSCVPSFEKISADHVTLHVRPNREQVASILELATEFRLWDVKLVACLSAEAEEEHGIQAVEVCLPHKVKVLCQNTKPHISISARRDVPFKESNSALETGPTHPIADFPVLHAQLAIRCRAGDRQTTLTDPLHIRCLLSQLTQTESTCDVAASMAHSARQTAAKGGKALLVFDFDGTLFITTDPKTGRSDYKVGPSPNQPDP